MLVIGVASGVSGVLAGFGLFAELSLLTGLLTERVISRVWVYRTVIIRHAHRKDAINRARWRAANSAGCAVQAQAGRQHAACHSKTFGAFRPAGSNRGVIACPNRSIRQAVICYSDEFKDSNASEMGLGHVQSLVYRVKSHVDGIRLDFGRRNYNSGCVAGKIGRAQDAYGRLSIRNNLAAVFFVK